MPDTRTDAGSLIGNRRMPRRSAGLLNIDSWFASIDLRDGVCDGATKVVFRQGHRTASSLQAKTPEGE